MERLTRKIKQFNVLFGTHLDNAENIVFNCICGFVYDGDAISSDSIALRSVSSDELSARRYVKDCIFSLNFVFSDVPVQISMTNGFTSEYFNDIPTIF